MAKGRTVLILTHPNAHVFLSDTRNRSRTLGNCITALRAAEGRTLGAGSSVAVYQGGTQASGTVTLSGASGTVGATVNGVSITVTYATSDANTGSLLAAAVNASGNALVSGIVTASAAGAVVTITAVPYGAVGNCITLAASGTGATASGARLTGGTEPTGQVLASL